MNALRYGIVVSEGQFASIHSCRYLLEEVHIPELGLFVNSETCFVPKTQEEIDQRLAHAENQQEFIISVDYRGGMSLLAQHLKAVDYLKKTAQTSLGLLDDEDNT